MTREEIIQSINDSVDGAINKMNRSVPAIQRNMLDELSALVRDLDYDGNNIARTVKNIRVIGQITRKLQKLILNKEYKTEVKEFIKAFNEVTTLQNTYMRQTTEDFKFSPVLKEIKTQSIDATLQGLTEQGLTANVTDKIQDVLRRNITSGGTFKQIMQQVRETMVNTQTGEGILERYVKQITTDSLNQYSRNYLQLATQSTGMTWYDYAGSNIETTRCFCFAMTKRRYFNVREIPRLLKGDFTEWQEMDCKMYDKTGLPQGMIAGTNVANFLTNLGGYNCGHRPIPIPERLVPKDVVEAFKVRYGVS